MSTFRAMTNATLLWAGLCASAAAMEVLPMDTPQDNCPGVSAQPADSEAASGEIATAATPDAGSAYGEVTTAPAGLEDGAVSERPTRSGGSAGTSVPASKPSSRWNAFLPGMVR